MARKSQDIERLFRMQKQIFLFSSWLLQKLDAQVYQLNERKDAFCWPFRMAIWHSTTGLSPTLPSG